MPARAGGDANRAGGDVQKNEGVKLRPQGRPNRNKTKLRFGLSRNARKTLVF
jgi:hypothetical protein